MIAISSIVFVTSSRRSAAPNVTGQQNLERRGQGHRQNGAEQAADQQAPDKNRNNDGDGVKADRIPNDPRGVEHSFEILDDNEI